MLRDYEAEFTETAKMYGRAMLQADGMGEIRTLVNRADLTADEVLNHITVVVEAVQKISRDKNLPWNTLIENDPF